MKPMLCRYWMYCCKKALHISCSQGSSFSLQGSDSVESQLWLRSLPDAAESFERWRFWKKKEFPKESCCERGCSMGQRQNDEQKTDFSLPQSSNSQPMVHAAMPDPVFTQPLTDLAALEQTIGRGTLQKG